jgi:hypothetical protein
MELVNAYDKNSFDPTPKLKSSPVPIFFVSFNEDDVNCIRCGEKYIRTIIYEQKYCKKCLSRYLTKITDNNMYLDVYFLLTKDFEYSKHEISRSKVSQNIQECCRNCLMILYFKQITSKYFFSITSDYQYLVNFIYESENYCKLCGKILYQRSDSDIFGEFKLCSNCYLISSGHIESTLTKKPISIIYLPWWENRNRCCNCYESLVFTSNCQKYCESCFIFFIGCRYCLTTNIIFGITNQSQCKKCKRVSIILDITKILSGNSVLDDFLINIRSYQLNIAKFSDNVKIIDNYFIPSKMCDSSLRIYINISEKLMYYITYSQFTNVKEITEGGFSIVYQATLLNGLKYDDRHSIKYWNGTKSKDVVLKRFKNPQCAKKYFISEVNTFMYLFYIIFIKIFILI